MKTLFCTYKGAGNLAIQALKILEKAGCETLLCRGGEVAPVTAVVIFEPEDTSAVNWPGRYTRMAAHRLVDIAPAWAIATPFLVAIRPNVHGDFQGAILGFARLYDRWLANGPTGFPWNDPPTNTDHQLELDRWQVQVNSVTWGNTWETTPGLWPPRKTKKAKAKGRGWQPQLATQRQATAQLVVVPTQAQLKKETALVSLLGAFNYDVGMSMEPGQLHQVYQQLVKRLALVAEAAVTGGGEQLFRLVTRLGKDELLDREGMMPLFEAVLLFGKPYGDLTAEQRQVAGQYQLSDEQGHFSRIMDVDALAGIKRQVGVTDAGNPLIARMLLNAARYREDIGVIAYYPLPHEPIVEAARFRGNLASQARVNYPYVACVISASDATLARDLIEIYRRLITQYPLEITFLMMEEWLMSMGIEDVGVSFVAVQVICKGDGQFEAKLVNVGGGAVAIRGSQSRIVHFDTKGQEYGEGLAVGRVDFQQPHHVRVLKVQPGDEIFVFPGTRELLADFKIVQLDRRQEVAMTVSPKRHQRLATFEWTSGYIQARLSSLVDQIVALKPVRVDVQFGHVHGDREPGPDQEVGASIAGSFARMLEAKRIHIEARPMSDNYHVVDRLDFRRWIALLQQHSGLTITEITFEDALSSRHLGDEAIARLYRESPEKIIFRGGNYYFQAGPDMMVELYDGVTTPDVPGRQGCVPFQLGYELYRLNPVWMNAAYRRYIMENYPNSLVARWWSEWPGATYQKLMLKHVYMLPCDQRMMLKARIDAEIDRPYRVKCMSGQTPFLDGILTATDFTGVVLIHVLEGFYDAQELKSTTLWQALGLPKAFQWRISFNRHTGELKALDWNRHIDF